MTYKFSSPRQIMIFVVICSVLSLGAEALLLRYNTPLNIFGALIIISFCSWQIIPMFLDTSRRNSTSIETTITGCCLLVILFTGTICGFASIYRRLGLVEGMQPVSDASSCLYFSLITWTTVGYGDLVPSHASRGFAAAEAVIGYVFMALLISIFLRLIQLHAPSVTDKTS